METRGTRDRAVDRGRSSSSRSCGSRSLIMGVYAFNSSNVQSWPIPGFTTHWFSVAWHDAEVRTALALAQGGALGDGGRARARHARRVRARALRGSSAASAVSFLFVLPIALPGIITGMALNSFFAFWRRSSLWTIVIGHATFCVVVVFNNVLARLRRTSGSFFEASADLGADGWQTFRYVTFRLCRRRSWPAGCSRSRSRGTRSSSRTSPPARRTRCRF